LIVCIESGAIALTSFAPAAAISEAWSDEEVPCANVTMNCAREAEVREEVEPRWEEAVEVLSEEEEEEEEEEPV
jgi:hypothetical protein